MLCFWVRHPSMHHRVPAVSQAPCLARCDWAALPSSLPGPELQPSSKSIDAWGRFSEVWGSTRPATLPPKSPLTRVSWLLFIQTWYSWKGKKELLKWCQDMRPRQSLCPPTRNKRYPLPTLPVPALSPQPLSLAAAAPLPSSVPPWLSAPA